MKQDCTIYTVDCGAEWMISQHRNFHNIRSPMRVQPSCQRQIVSLPMIKWKCCFPYPKPSFWTMKSCDLMMSDNWIMFVKMIEMIRKFVATKLDIKKLSICTNGLTCPWTALGFVTAPFFEKPSSNKVAYKFSGRRKSLLSFLLYSRVNQTSKTSVVIGGWV